MAKKHREDASASFEDLLAADDPQYEPGASADSAPADADESAEDARIAELKAALAAPLPQEIVVAKTPKQLEIEELEDQLARRNAAVVDRAPDAYRESVGDGEKILFHFREDGLLVLGNSWLRGQELEITVGSPDYQRTLNRQGKSWLDIVDDEDAQIAKWGKRYIAPGPFKPRKGEEFNDDVAREDKRRRRAVPVMGR